MTAVADTGAVYALIDRDDGWHARVVAWWRAARHPVLLPVTIVPEITYLLRGRIGPAAEEAFVTALASGEFVVEPVDQEDISRAAQIMRKYEELGFVDATIVAVAERVEARELLTTDRRHFTSVRPKHARAFTLLP